MIPQICFHEQSGIHPAYKNFSSSPSASSRKNRTSYFSSPSSAPVRLSGKPAPGRLVREFLRGRAQAQAGKCHAPPVMPLSLADGDPQGFVDTGGQGEGVIVAGIKGFLTQRHHRLTVAPRRFQNAVSDGPEFGAAWPVSTPSPRLRRRFCSGRFEGYLARHPAPAI